MIGWLYDDIIYCCLTSNYFVLFGYMQKTVFGGQPQKADYKDIPYAVFRYSCVYVLKLGSC